MDDAEAGLRAVQSLPPVNLRVLRYLVAFLRRLTDEKISEVTKVRQQALFVSDIL